jgi:probable addiction module antidote protein
MTRTRIHTRPFDAAEYLDNEASIHAFIGDAMESGDPAILQHALSTAARARGIARIAEESGLGRESLYKALRPDARPQFGTVVKVLGALGVKLVPQPKAAVRKRNAVKAAKAAVPAKRASKPRASKRA